MSSTEQTGSTAQDIPRRPLKTRQAAWAVGLADRLIRWRIAPNLISMMSIVFAAAAGLLLGISAGCPPTVRSVLFVLAAASLQLRLLCNLLDGMVAVGANIHSKRGEVFNDLPDRISDCLIFVGAGYALGTHRWGVELGWLAAVLAVLTAYVRVLGSSLGLAQNFTGPMAKPHRMALLTGALLLAAVLTAKPQASDAVLALALVLVNVGCLATVWRRVSLIIKALETR